ncbi:MAG: hypothetical protein AAFP28_12275 [Pseudomonadota bacterium]
MTGEAFSLQLIGPAVVLVALAWILPTQVAKRMPETMTALAINMIFSAAALWGFAALGFAVSYYLQGVPVDVLWSGSQHFITLGLLAGMFWGPILLLALTMEPQKWRPDL